MIAAIAAFFHSAFDGAAQKRSYFQTEMTHVKELIYARTPRAVHLQMPILRVGENFCTVQ